MRRHVLLSVLSVVVLLVLYLLLWPVKVDPAAWEPPASPPLEGVFARNDRLAAVERLDAGGHAPEGVAVDADGNVYAGLEDGRVVRLRAGGGPPEVFADTRGRPLGLEFDGAGNLVIADAYRGLLVADRGGALSVLSREAAGRPFGCVNDLAVASDGTVYFTDATDRFPLSVYRQDIVEHRPNGRLLAYDPAARAARVVFDGLHFANGVALGPGESFVVVAETGKYRLWRVWLKGPRSGGREVFIDNLPGFPDNVTFNGRETFWVALVSPRNKLLDALLPRPFLRKVIVRLPPFMQPAPARHGFVLGLDAEGRVTHNLQDPSGSHYALVSSAVEHAGALYLGSLGEDAVGRLRLER
ncbi:MAG TPA: SMP-30/gluconolactonase/LRE family protein [Pyrinomonadaceae bacterium]|nr:SMP-30/gluconolactonase/LRE family protein [Pyrinomonadaceae bacterium]